MGRFTSGVLAQSLILWDLVDYRGLNWIALASVTLAAAVSLALPPVREGTRYFHTSGASQSWRQVWPELKKDFSSAYSSSHVVKWSLWWALGTCGNFQVGNYVQPLWETIAPVDEVGRGHIYNGAVEAATTLAGAALSFAFGFIRLNWSILGEPVLFFLSCLSGILLFVMAGTDNIWMAYAGYFGFRILYQMLITVAR